MPELAGSRRRHPHQIFVGLLVFLTGLPVLLTGLFGGLPMGRLESSMPHLLVYVEAGVLVVGGLLVLAAAAVRNLLTALYFELAADLPVAVALWTYAASAVALAGASQLRTLLIFGGAGVAFFARFIQVRRAARQLRRELVRRAEVAA